MKKIIKKWGNSLVIVFNKEDEKIFPEIKEENIIDLSDMKIKKPKKVKGDE